MTTSAPARPPSLRVAQKQARARRMIVEAADRLTRLRSVEDVSIKDITEAADVGQGTFYTHFKSKNEVLIPIMQADAARLDLALQAAFDQSKAPAVILGISARIMGRYVTSDERWRWVLKNSSVPLDEMRHAFGQFGGRDYGKGVSTGDFIEMAPAVTESFAFGGFINVLVSHLDSDERERAIDQAVELMLRALGINRKEAASIASQPLPTVEFDQGAHQSSYE